MQVQSLSAKHLMCIIKILISQLVSRGVLRNQQEPVFCRGSRHLLEPGMVVALEPFLGHWHCQDLFLITEDKPELLSSDFDTRQLLAIEV